MNNTTTIEISDGLLSKADSSTVPYQIINGLDSKLSQRSDITWGTFNLENLKHIQKNIPTEDQEKVLISLQPEDSHWNWFNKSVHYNTTEYEWFYLIADNDIQCICLVFQPKESVLNNGKIYYIEYLAVAPWNRTTLIANRKYLGVAGTLIQTITEFLYETKGLNAAYSLHSLPQATDYYKHLGMVHCPTKDKGSLKFFEIPLAHTKIQLEAHQC